MARCPHCEREVEPEFRFCPGCAEPLRLKLVEFFPGADPEEKRSLRVSRYLETGQVRFSVWDETGTVRGAVSLDDDEAERLAGFVGPARPGRRERLLEDLRAAFLLRRPRSVPGDEEDPGSVGGDPGTPAEVAGVLDEEPAGGP